MEVVEACVSKEGCFLRSVERTGRKAVYLPVEYKEQHYNRLERLRNALLVYANANLGSCCYFEPPIDSEDKKMRAFRISLDLWDDPSLIDKYMRTLGSQCSDADLAVLSSWKSVLAGPMLCMETHGDKALFMCDGYVFEVISYGRQWDDMIPYAPDLVVTSLLPYEDDIVLGGFTTRHYAPLAGPGIQRINGEFREALSRGVITNAQQFCEVSSRINADRKRNGVEVNQWVVYMDSIDEINSATEDSCFPYEPTLRLRDEAF